ncbi:MAG: TVP38/TMEM64 family protein [Spirochaetes bacterium]|nr:TVP38/TMEM64 family protein [Spirochaetota bacterium]
MDRINLKRFLLFFISLLGLFVSLYLVFRYRSELSLLYSSPYALRIYIREWGIYGPLLFIGLQILQVIVFIIPGEITQLTGGYLFGFWFGLFYSLVGITLGAMFNFFVAKVLGKPVVLKIFGREKVEKFVDLMESSQAKGVLLFLFILPGFPKDLLCYVVGLTRYRFLYFLLVSTLGRLPGLVISSYLGDAAALYAWKEASIALVIGVVLFALGLWGRKKFLSRHSRLKTPATEGEGSHSSGSPPEEV